MNLRHLTDKVLLADTKVLVGKERGDFAEGASSFEGD